MSIKDNRSKGKLTIYEYISDRDALNVDEGYLKVIDYPKQDELRFIDYSKEEFIKEYNTFIKNRENRLGKQIRMLIKKKLDTL